MAEALKIVSVQRGHDPREFALAAFGGAGPLHAVALAERTRHRRDHLPADPRGVLGARPHRYRLEARLCPHAVHHGRGRRSGCPGGRLRRARSAGERRCSIAPASRPQRRRFERSVDARYPRQSHELVGAGSAAPRSTRPRSPRSRRRSTIATCTPMATTIAASRCRSSAFASPPSARSRRWRSATRWRRPERTRQVKAPGSGSAKPARSTPRSMTAGACRRDFEVPGPAVIESLESTILVPPGWQAKMNEDGFVLLTRRPDFADLHPVYTRRRAPWTATSDAKQRCKTQRAAPIPPPSRSSRTASTRSPRRCGSSSPRPPTLRC